MSTNVDFDIPLLLNHSTTASDTVYCESSLKGLGISYIFSALPFLLYVCNWNGVLQL